MLEQLPVPGIALFEICKISHQFSVLLNTYDVRIKCSNGYNILPFKCTFVIGSKHLTIYGQTHRMPFSCADLYHITMEEALSLEGFKQRKAEKMLSALEKSKSCALDAFLHAVGIPNIGRKTARDLAATFGTLQKVREATLEQLVAIPDVGDIVAQSVVEFFSYPENSEMIERLLAAGVKPQEAAGKAEGPFTGMSIVVTGTLPTLSRKDAEALICQMGGTAAGSVSKKTAFVVAGEAAGSKLTKAESLGVEVIDEAELLRRCGR